jgi:hypothetical protein
VAAAALNHLVVGLRIGHIAVQASTPVYTQSASEGDHPRFEAQYSVAGGRGPVDIVDGRRGLGLAGAEEQKGKQGGKAWLAVSPGRCGAKGTTYRGERVGGPTLNR